MLPGIYPCSSPYGHDDLEVLARHDERAVAAAIRLAQQLDELHLQLRGAFRRKRGERLVHRAVPHAEHLDEVRRRAVAEVEGPLANAHARGLRAEEGAHMRL